MYDDDYINWLKGIRVLLSLPWPYIHRLWRQTQPGTLTYIVRSSEVFTLKASPWSNPGRRAVVPVLFSIPSEGTITKSAFSSDWVIMDSLFALWIGLGEVRLWSNKREEKQLWTVIQTSTYTIHPRDILFIPRLTWCSQLEQMFVEQMKKIWKE